MNFLGILRIELLCGVDLKPLDPNRISHPYVIFSCSGKLSKSKIIKKSLSPVWKETIMMNIDDCVGMVDVTCWDHNKYRADVPLGKTQVNLIYFLDELEHFMVLKLERGELHLNFQFTKL